MVAHRLFLDFVSQLCKKKTKAYAQMNLVPQAKSVLAELQKKYPNTVEAKMAHGWVTQ